MNDFNAQLYSGIALQNADELTGNHAKDKLLAYLGTQAGTQLLAELFKNKLNTTPKLPQGKPSLNASPSEFFGTPEIKQNAVQPMQPKLALPTSMLQQNPQQFFNSPTSTAQTTNIPVTPQQNFSFNTEFNPTLPQSQGGMNQAVQSATDGLTPSSSSPSSPTISKDALVSGGAGIIGGLAGQYAGNKLGGLVFDTNTKGGAFASGVAGQLGSTIASTAATNLVSNGSLSLSGLGSAASLGQGAMGVANIALDAFDPVKKSKGENIVGMGLGAVGAAAALASIPVAGWIAGGALLATNIVGHALGKKTDSFTMDKDLYSQMGASYGGSMYKAQDAMNKANQKYSAFNNGARKEANKEIAEASRQQDLVTDISEEATDRRNIAQYMAAFNGLRRRYQLQGGYDQSAIHVAKNGIKIERLNKVKDILKSYNQQQTNQLQKGGEIKLDDFEYYLSTLPENQRDSTNFRVKDYWIFNGKPKDFQEAINKEMFSQQSDGKWHANTIAWNPETGEGEFMKSPNHETIQKEIDWYNSKDGENFRRQYTLVKSTPYWKYVKKHEGGGSIIEITSDVEMFQKGGTINVIPEGALHARKHNMEMDGITKKGIPVVDKEGEQQAEIERNEVILRLEVTQKLEELSKIYYSEESSEEEKEQAALDAGKLLSDEILYNTQDNTGLLNGNKK